MPIISGVVLSSESIVTIAGMMFAFLGALIGLLTLSYRVLGGSYDKFLTRLESQEKHAAQEKADLHTLHAKELAMREDTFNKSYTALSEAFIKRNEQSATAFAKLDTDIGGITEQFTHPGEGVKAKLDTVIKQLTELRQHIDNTQLDKIYPLLSAIQMSLTSITPPTPADETNGRTPAETTIQAQE